MENKGTKNLFVQRALTGTCTRQGHELFHCDSVWVSHTTPPCESRDARTGYVFVLFVLCFFRGCGLCAEAPRPRHFNVLGRI